MRDPRTIQDITDLMWECETTIHEAVEWYFSEWLAKYGIKLVDVKCAGVDTENVLFKVFDYSGVTSVRRIDYQTIDRMIRKANERSNNG